MRNRRQANVELFKAHRRRRPLSLGVSAGDLPLTSNTPECRGRKRHSKRFRALADPSSAIKPGAIPMNPPSRIDPDALYPESEGQPMADNTGECEWLVKIMNAWGLRLP